MGELMQFVDDIAGAAGDRTRHRFAAGHSSRGDGGALVYVFDSPDGRLLYQDTSGHWSGVIRDLRPDVGDPRRRRPRHTSTVSRSRARLPSSSPARSSAAGPRTVVLGHHDNWLPGFSVDTDIAPIREAIEESRPRLDSSSSTTSTPPRSSPDREHAQARPLWRAASCSAQIASYDFRFVLGDQPAVLR